MSSSAKQICLNEAVLKTLQYFHLFRHPLHFDEIYRFCGTNVCKKDLQAIVDEMVAEGEIYRIEGYYLLEKNAAFVHKRKTGSTRAQLLMQHAQKSVATISRFPFVKNVSISGSLSKGYANELSDIDLFIITQKNRLWICRSFLHLYKKFTFLRGNQHSYCMNYFIDESKLCLEEQNIFTATELATLIPMYNTEVHRELIKANKWWAIKLLPNIPWSTDMVFTEHHSNLVRRATEFIINMCFPNVINQCLMHITDKWWRLKWRLKNYPMQDYDLAMKTKWYVSKNHPLNYQKKVLEKNNSTSVFRKIAIDI
jgi:predicted nucleotidyltransferase